MICLFMMSLNKFYRYFFGYFFDRDLFDFVVFSENNAYINLQYYATKGRFLLFILI